MSRATIRTAVQTAVLASGAVAAGRAYIGRRDAIPEGLLPAACIFGDSEDIEPISWLADGTRRFQRIFTLVVEVYAQESSSTACEAVLDGLTASIESQIGDDPTLSGATKDITPASVSYDIGTTGSPVTGAARCEYQAVYETVEGA